MNMDFIKMDVNEAHNLLILNIQLGALGGNVFICVSLFACWLVRLSASFHKTAIRIFAKLECRISLNPE